MTTIPRHYITRLAMTTLATVTLLLQQALLTSSHGTLLAEDGFATGTAKEKGEWSPGGVHDLGNSHIVTPGWNRILGPAKIIYETGLNHPVLQTAGDGSVDAYGWWSYRDTVDFAGNPITYDANTGFDAIYVSFLTRHYDAGPVLVAMGAGGDNGSKSPIQITGTGENHAFRLGEIIHDLAVARTSDVNLWVIKFAFAGGSEDSITLWLNPGSLGGAEPANATLSVAYPDIAFNRLLFGESGPNSRLDEIRIGTTYAAVTPTP